MVRKIDKFTISYHSKSDGSHMKKVKQGQRVASKNSDEDRCCLGDIANQREDNPS